NHSRFNTGFPLDPGTTPGPRMSQKVRMSSLISAVAVALLLALKHPSIPKGMSHEEHLKQMEKDEALKKRGAEAMGFDQDATTHHFKLAPSGGSIEATVKNEKDETMIEAVRSHLRSIAADFARGNFDKPFCTHSEDAA